MLNKILELLFKIVFWIVGIFSSVVLLPIYSLLSSLIKDFPDYTETFYSFLNYKIFPIIPFVREVFINVTGLPRDLFNAIITIYLLRLGLHFTIISFRFLFKIYYIIRGSVTSKE